MVLSWLFLSFTSTQKLVEYKPHKSVDTLLDYPFARLIDRYFIWRCDAVYRMWSHLILAWPPVHVHAIASMSSLTRPLHAINKLQSAHLTS